jgi:hypothetical protein
MYIQVEGLIISFIVSIPISILWVYFIDHSKKTLEQDEKEKETNP